MIRSLNGFIENRNVRKDADRLYGDGSHLIHSSPCSECDSQCSCYFHKGARSIQSRERKVWRREWAWAISSAFRIQTTTTIAPKWEFSVATNSEKRMNNIEKGRQSEKKEPQALQAFVILLYTIIIFTNRVTQVSIKAAAARAIKPATPTPPTTTTKEKKGNNSNSNAIFDGCKNVVLVRLDSCVCAKLFPFMPYVPLCYGVHSLRATMTATAICQAIVYFVQPFPKCWNNNKKNIFYSCLTATAGTTEKQTTELNRKKKEIPNQTQYIFISVSIGGGINQQAMPFYFSLVFNCVLFFGLIWLFQFQRNEWMQT